MVTLVSYTRGSPQSPPPKSGGNPQMRVETMETPRYWWRLLRLQKLVESMESLRYETGEATNPWYPGVSISLSRDCWRPLDTSE